MSDTVTVPTGIRVGAYLTGIVTNALGDPAITYLAAENRIDTATGVFLAALFAAVAVVAGVLALSHLTLPVGAGGPVSLPARRPLKKAATKRA